MFNPDEPLNDAIRIGEQGKLLTDPSDLLGDARNALAGIGFIQAQKPSAVPSPVPRMGYFSRALLVCSCEAPKDS